MPTKMPQLNWKCDFCNDTFESKKDAKNHEKHYHWDDLQAKKEAAESNRFRESIESPCYIATACYGTPSEPKLDILRFWRDHSLKTNFFGNLFVKFYYKTSPPIARFIAKHDSLRFIIRNMLVDPVVMLVRKKGEK